MQSFIEVEKKVQLMKNIGFFVGFPSEDLAATAQMSDWLKFSPGDTIIKEGEPGSSFCILLRGNVQVVKRTPANTRGKALAIIPCGECFGEMSIISGQPRTADIVAMDEVFLFKIEGTKLGTAPESLQLKFYKRFAEVLVSRLVRASNTLTSPHQRVG